MNQRGPLLRRPIIGYPLTRWVIRGDPSDSVGCDYPSELDSKVSNTHALRDAWRASIGDMQRCKLQQRSHQKRSLPLLYLLEEAKQ